MNVLRVLAAIALVLFAAGVAGFADVASHVRTRIVEPTTATQIADTVWQQPELRDRIAVESTTALMQRPRTLKLLRSAVTAGTGVDNAQANELVRKRVLEIERQVLAQPQSRQLFVKMVSDAHANFTQQITTVPPDQLNSSQLFTIDLRPFLPVVGRTLQLNSDWLNQVPVQSTVLHPQASSQGDLTGIRYLARFVQMPTWMPWLIAAAFFIAGLLVVPWRAIAFGTATVGLLAAALAAAATGGLITAAQPAGNDPVGVQMTTIVIDALAADVAAIRNHLLVGAALCAAITAGLLLAARARSRATF